MRRLLAVATLSVVATVALVGVTGARQAMAAPQAGQGCILGIICLPSGSPSPVPSPSSAGTPAPSPSLGLPLLGSSASPSSSSPASAGASSGTASPTASPSASPKNAAGTPGLVASDATAVLTAGTANITGFHYAGNVDVATAAGAQKMMKFTADSVDLSGTVTVTVIQNGVTVKTVSTTQDFGDGVTLYATELSGTLVPVQGLPGAPLDLTPSTITVANLLKLPNAGELQLANLVTGAIPLTLTGVTTDQLLISGGTQVTTQLSMS
ncbi:MAG: hypothetical protein JWO75_6439 [Actinomycetia bacterium]|nr:hypothetical protein [Actinomycetes bacterium]